VEDPTLPSLEGCGHAQNKMVALRLKLGAAVNLKSGSGHLNTLLTHLPGCSQT